MLSVFPIIGIICVAISIYYYISKDLKRSIVFELVGNFILMIYCFYSLLMLGSYGYLFFGIMFLCFLIKNIFDLKKLLGDSKHV